MTVAAPDARQLAAETLGAAPFPGRADGLRVYFDKSVHAAIHKHAVEDTTIEICGVLVGAWKRDEGGGGPYVHVSASIRGDAAASKLAEVTFTHETWAKINQRMDKEFADLVIVGWYHTHPDFGVFLSDRDVFIHQHFFSAPGQVALVVDPIRREEGVFTWKDGKPVLAPAHWVGEGQRWAPRPEGSSPMARGAEQSEGTQQPAAPQPAPSQPRTSASAVMMLAAALGFFAAGYFFSNFNERQQHTLVAQALAEQLYNRTSSPETRRSIQELRALLAEIGEETSKLAAPKKEGAEPPSPEKISAAINQRLAAASTEVDNALRAQALSPEQQLAIDAILQQRLQELVARGAIVVSRPGDAPPPAPSAPADKPAAPKPEGAPSKQPSAPGDAAPAGKGGK